jgi:hypothetical protein
MGNIRTILIAGIATMTLANCAPINWAGDGFNGKYPLNQAKAECNFELQKYANAGTTSPMMLAFNGMDYAKSCMGSKGYYAGN